MGSTCTYLLIPAKRRKKKNTEITGFISSERTCIGTMGGFGMPESVPRPAHTQPGRESGVVDRFVQVPVAELIEV